jgi:hypothetical protein
VASHFGCKTRSSLTVGAFSLPALVADQHRGRGRSDPRPSRVLQHRGSEGHVVRPTSGAWNVSLSDASAPLPWVGALASGAPGDASRVTRGIGGDNSTIDAKVCYSTANLRCSSAVAGLPDVPTSNDGCQGDSFEACQ